MSHYELIKKEEVVDSSYYMLIVWWWVSIIILYIVCITSLSYLVIKAGLLWCMIIGAIVFLSQIVGLAIKVELKPTIWKIILHIVVHFAMLFAALYWSDMTDWISIIIGIIFYLSSYRLSKSYNLIKNHQWCNKGMKL